MRPYELTSSRVRHGLVAVTVMFCGVLLNITTVLGADPDRFYEPYKLRWQGPDADVSLRPMPPYMVESDRVAKAFMDELVKSLCELKKSGQVKKVSQTEVPQSIPLLDELNYLLERRDDAIVKVGGFLGLWRADGATETNESLSYLLFHSEQPSLTGIQNRFVRFTKEAAMDVEGLPFPVSRELALALKISQSKDDSLAPKDVLKMAVEVSGGDYPAATLLAHNLLKEITYSGRSRAEKSTFQTVSGSPGSDAAYAASNANRLKEYKTALKNTPFIVFPRENGVLTISMDPGAPVLAAKLRNMRVAGDPHIAGTRDPHFGDKLGPWYHAFGVLFLSSTAKGGRFTAGTWANVEGLARHVPIFPSAPDYFKELFTNLAAEQSGAIIDCLGQVTDAPAQPIPCIPKKGATLYDEDLCVKNPPTVTTPERRNPPPPPVQ